MNKENIKEYGMVRPDVIKNHIGDYICFGGTGILDGLQFVRDRSYLYKIISIDDDGLHVKGYNKRRGNVLPSYNFNQACRIVTKAEYKNTKPPAWKR